jgi:hypothetical protein
MLTTQDFIDKYQTYTDLELYTVRHNIHQYSEDAGKALAIVIDNKGGLDALIKRLEAQATIEKEKQRIANEATKLGLGGVDAAFIKNTTSSALLSKEEVDHIVESNAAKAELQVKDRKVNTETIVKCIIGGALATITGGAFASLQSVYFGATSAVMVIGTGLICYFTVKWFTKKSFNNTAVFLASLIAFFLSYAVAQLAVAVFGYLG